MHFLLHVIQLPDNYMQKYGTQMVESGIKTISKPVIDQLPVNQINEFACCQLDRVSCHLINLVNPGCLVCFSNYNWAYLIFQSCNISQLLNWNSANCSKSALTKRTQWEFSLYCALLIYKNVYLLSFVYACDHHISIKSSCR